MKYLGLFFLIIHLCGCFDVRTPELPKLPAKSYNPTPPAGPQASADIHDVLSSSGWHDKALALQNALNDVNDQMAELKAKQWVLKGQVNNAKKNEDAARDEERVSLGQAWLWSIGAVCGFLAIACLALRQWPIIKIAKELAGDPLLSIAKGFGIATACCIVLAFLLAYLIVAVKWLIIGSVVVAVPVAGWLIYKYLKKTLVAEHFAGVADNAIATLNQAAPGTNFADKVKIVAQGEQIASGISTDVKKILADIRA